jgi:hypothetical protein
MTGALVCPSCAAPHPDDERFCDDCGLPLVHAGDAVEAPPRSELAIRARKVRPGYAEGPLVRAAWARNQAEAELVQGLLLEEGIPSLARRSGGFDVPDFLAAGPRDVLVPESGYQAARELLSGADLLTAEAEPGSLPGIGSPGRLAAWLLAAVLFAGALVWFLYQATG